MVRAFTLVGAERGSEEMMKEVKILPCESENRDPSPTWTSRGGRAPAAGAGPTPARRRSGGRRAGSRRCAPPARAGEAQAPRRSGRRLAGGHAPAPRGGAAPRLRGRTGSPPRRGWVGGSSKKAIACLFLMAT